MKTTIHTVGALMLLFVGYHTSEAQSENYFGDCRGAIMRNIQDLNINRVYAHEFPLWNRGVYTGLRIDNRYPLFPTISGQYGAKIENFLDQLSKQGYYTVNLVNFINGGWVIQGNKKIIQERQARQRVPDQWRSEQIQRTQKKVNQETSRSETETNASSAGSGGRNCSVYLYSDMHKPDYRVESYITVKGEYINVTWGNTEVNQGEPYDFDVHIENRSGNKRTLKAGKNWVDPGRYRVYLTFHGIRSTSVTIEYYGDCE